MIQTAVSHPGATPALVMSLRCCQLSWICQHFVLVSYSLNEQTCSWSVTSSDPGWGNRNPDIGIFYLFPSAQVNSISEWSTKSPANSRCYEARCTLRTQAKCELHCYMAASALCIYIDSLFYVRKKIVLFMLKVLGATVQLLKVKQHCQVSKYLTNCATSTVCGTTKLQCYYCSIPHFVWCFLTLNSKHS